MTRMIIAALLLAIALGTAACNTSDDVDTGDAMDEQQAADVATPEIVERGGGQDADDSEPSGAAIGLTATVISRLPATATPTEPPDPLQPVDSDVLSGIVVPLGAELLKHTMATDTSDASADYAVAGIDNETLLEWFRENMVAIGWVEDDERDGALIFLHDEEMSARHPDEARSATVFFATIDGLPEGAGSFTIIAELPYDEDAAAADETDTVSDTDSDDESAGNAESGSAAQGEEGSAEDAGGEESSDGG